MVDTLYLYLVYVRALSVLLQKDCSLLRNSLNCIRFLRVLILIKVNVSPLPFNRFIMLTIEVVHLIAYRVICVENVNRCWELAAQAIATILHQNADRDLLELKSRLMYSGRVVQRT